MFLLFSDSRTKPASVRLQLTCTQCYGCDVIVRLVLSYGFAQWDNPYETVVLDSARVATALEAMGDVFSNEELAALQSIVEDGMPTTGTAAPATAHAADQQQQQPFVLSRGDPLPLGLLQLARLVALHEEKCSEEIGRLIERASGT